MIVYFQNELPDSVAEFLSQDDEYNPQDYVPKRIEDRIAVFQELVALGKLVVFSYSNNIIITLKRTTSWIGNFDTKVKEGTSVREVIKAYKAFFDWAKGNTYYYKLETRTPFEKYGRVMAKATGALLEGTRKYSYMDREGKMNDEYEYGYVLRGNE